MAGLSPDIGGGQDGMVSLWEEGGPPRIHFPGRGREPPSPAFGCGYDALGNLIPKWKTERINLFHSGWKQWYNRDVHEEFDLKADFFDWVDTLLKEGEDRYRRILAFDMEDPSQLDPLLKDGRSLDALGKPEIAGKADASYDLMLCPTCFLSPDKESATALGKQLGRLAAPGSLTLALFPPAWLPSMWADRVVKFHREANTRLYFRFKTHIAAYTFYTNREIASLIPGLYLERLTILQDGFRRAHFVPGSTDRAQ